MTQPNAALPFEVFADADRAQRIQWNFPLDNAQPAEDAERLIMELGDAGTLQSESHPLELDLFHCTTINTRGIAFLIYLGRKFDLMGVRWTIINAPMILNRMLQTLCLQDSFDVGNVRTDSASSTTKTLNRPTVDDNGSAKALNESSAEKED